MATRRGRGIVRGVCRSSLFLLFLMGLLVATGCGGARRPSAVVRQFFSLVQEQEFDQAGYLLTVQSHFVFSFTAGIIRATGGAGLAERVETTAERISGDKAEVTVLAHHPGGIEEEVTVHLVRVNREWKICLLNSGSFLERT